MGDRGSGRNTSPLRIGDYEIRLIGEKPEAQKLSEAEENLLDEVFSRYGNANRWDLG